MLKRLIAVLVFLAPLPLIAGDADLHPEQRLPASAVEQLSAGMRQLLAREMAALQEGMQALVPALVAGRWSVVADVAGQMQDSYILAQELTPPQVRELHHSLPSSFRTMDQEFHRLAGMLAHAAERRNPELVSFYYYKLTDSCLSCHQAFALHRFPDLAPQQSTAGHDHQH